MAGRSSKGLRGGGLYGGLWLAVVEGGKMCGKVVGIG